MDTLTQLYDLKSECKFLWLILQFFDWEFLAWHSNIRICVTSASYYLAVK